MVLVMIIAAMATGEIDIRGNHTTSAESPRLFFGTLVGFFALHVWCVWQAIQRYSAHDAET